MGDWFKVWQINALPPNENNMYHFNKCRPKLMLISEKQSQTCSDVSKSWKGKLFKSKKGKKKSIKVTNGKKGKMHELFGIQSNTGWWINRHQIKIQWNPEHSKNKRFWLDPNGSDSKDIRRTVKLVIWLGEIGNRPISICRSDGGRVRACAIRCGSQVMGKGERVGGHQED